MAAWTRAKVWNYTRDWGWIGEMVFAAGATRLMKHSTLSSVLCNPTAVRPCLATSSSLSLFSPIGFHPSCSLPFSPAPRVLSQTTELLRRSDDSVTAAIGVLVRKRLCDALFRILTHGLYKR